MACSLSVWLGKEAVDEHCVQLLTLFPKQVCCKTFAKILALHTECAS